MINEIDENEEKLYKLTIYDNERLRVQYHPTCIFPKRTIINPMPPLKIRNYK